MWCGEPDAIGNAIEYRKFFSRSHYTVIRVYDKVNNVIETHERGGDFEEAQTFWIEVTHLGTSRSPLIVRVVPYLLHDEEQVRGKQTLGEKLVR